MEYIYAIVGVILLLVVSEYINEKKRKEKLKKNLLKAWGTYPSREYSDEIYCAIKKYYLMKKEIADKEDFYLDEITWSDLDMQGVYEMINSSSCSIGREYLYYILRKLSFKKEELNKRDELISLFEKDKNTRLDIQMILSNIGKKNKISVAEYISTIKRISYKNCVFHCLQAVLLVISVILIICGAKAGILLTLFFIFINVATYYKGKADIDPYLKMFSCVVLMSKAAEKISHYDNSVIKNYSSEIDDINNSIKKLRKGIFLLSATSPSGGFWDSIMDYVKMLFHIDIITFYTMLGVLQENQKKIERLYEIIGTIDSMCAIASFRCYLNYYCKPEFAEYDGKNILYNAKDIYHPFIKKPVSNSIFEDKCVLLTGSNASGKSTFIKTLALNAILSQTIFTSISNEYKGCFYHVYSSMALKDNLVNSESYYMVEIKSLKRIIDGLNKKYPVLCFVDEVLRGTNTLERIAASSQILCSMANNGYMCFAATHDIELTKILEGYFNNYHFQEKVENDDVVFDYKLQEGPAKSRNAIKLLGIIGYSKEIIDNASDRANYFLDNGLWQKL